MSGNYPDNYLLFNQKLSKQLSLVLEIEGVGLFGVADTFTKIRYGDPGLIYGLPGLVYGGLRNLNTVKPYIMLDGGLTIQQRIEPESGRGNIGQLVINLIDYNGEVSYALAPGNVVPEIMGQLCRLWLGYTQTSYPDDYVLVYQGNITQITCPPGKVSLQISDPTTKARQPLFALGTTTLLADLPATGSSATVQIDNTAVLHQQILGPNGQYDPTVSTYIVVDSEIMQYAATGIISPTQVVVARAALGSTIADHTAGTSVNGSVGFGQVGGINCIDLALKLLLSGFGGPEFTDVSVLSFVYDYNGNNVPNEFVLSTEDASLDLGLSSGDYFYITGSASGNSVSGRITGITAGAQGRDTIVQTDQTFTIENPTSALVAFRSQYDTFPTTCGLGCFTNEVDVSTFQQIRKNYFTAGGASDLVAYYDQAAVGLDTIVNDIMLPIGCYSISRYGRISMAITKPPLPGSGTKLVQLDYTNIVDPDKIQVVRATNQRSFYNEVSYEYDFDVINQSFNSVQYFLDTNSLKEFGYTVVLPIQANTVSSALGGALIAQTRGNAILDRFKDCLIWLELTVNWSVGSLLEVSDIVVVKDDGNLKIMNFETGERNIGTQLFEVIDRNYQIITGNVKLKLLGGLGFNLTNRFGLISPSSILGAGCTTTSVRVTPSFGQPDIPSEMLKWSPLVGQGVMVHDALWSVTGASFIQAVSSTDPSALILSPALPFAPSAGNILDIAPYPQTATTTNALEAGLYGFITPSIPVLTGLSDTEFTVAPASAGIINVGNWVTLRDTDYETQSPQDTVEGVTGGTVQVLEALTSGGSTFVPTSAFFVEGIGFRDGTGAYLYG
jgi:hypothetical protein